MHLRVRAYAAARQISLSKAAQELLGIAFHTLRTQYDLDINDAIDVMTEEEAQHYSKAKDKARKRSIARK